MLLRLAAIGDEVGRRINWFVERCCVVLLATMVMVIWWGVVGRYFIGFGATWTEEFSRYVMIWTALLAISSGAYHREHIGLDFIVNHLPEKSRRRLKIAFDLLGSAFFFFLMIFGIGMTINGKNQYATIFGMTMVVPFASVPISACLTAIQILVTLFRDLLPEQAASHQAKVSV